MKTIISPSILGGSFSNMEKIIKSLDQSEAEYIHFDVMDGDFVPNLTFGPQFISNLRNQTKKVFDIHLMINRVGKFLDEDGKRKVGVYIILDKQEQLNQPSFFKALEKIIEMSEKTNRFLIKTF